MTYDIDINGVQFTISRNCDHTWSVYSNGNCIAFDIQTRWDAENVAARACQ